MAMLNVLVVCDLNYHFVHGRQGACSKMTQVSLEVESLYSTDYLGLVAILGRYIFILPHYEFLELILYDQLLMTHLL